MHAQPTALRRSLAYSAACAALQHKGRKAAGRALVLRLATGAGTTAEFQRPGPLGAEPLQAISVFVALCRQDAEGQVFLFSACDMHEHVSCCSKQAWLIKERFLLTAAMAHAGVSAAGCAAAAHASCCRW
jgi:hypothetical protein